MTTRSQRRAAAMSAIVAAARLALPQRCELCVARTEGGLLCDACERSLPRIAAPCPVCALPSDTRRQLRRVHRPSAALRRDHRRISRTPFPPTGCFSASNMAAASRSPNGRAWHSPPRCAFRSPAGARATSLTASSRCRLRRARQRERGFNQAREIAIHVARRTGLPLAAPLLRIAAGPPQATLEWAQRRRNVRGAFAVAGDVRGARIALVDDVMTTGATLAEASRTLVAAGARARRMLGRRAHAAALRTTGQSQ